MSGRRMESSSSRPLLEEFITSRRPYRTFLGHLGGEISVQPNFLLRIGMIYRTNIRVAADARRSEATLLYDYERGAGGEVSYPDTGY